MLGSVNEIADFLRDADVQDRIAAAPSAEVYDNTDDDFPYPAF